MGIYSKALKNEKESCYSLSNSHNQIKNILTNPVIDGVFGIEIHRYEGAETAIVFTPSYFKLNLDIASRDSAFDTIKYKDDITFSKFLLSKASMFPIDVDWDESLYEIICKNVPRDIGVMYQMILSFRQDDWKGRLKEQYEDYLGGIENPFDSKIFRGLQRKINDGVDKIFKTEYKHNPISEVLDKINDVGFRYNARVILYDGTKKGRIAILKNIKEDMNRYSYVNNWDMELEHSDSDVDSVINRHMGATGKSQVLCARELMPMMTYGASTDNVIIKEIDNTSVEVAEVEVISAPRDDYSVDYNHNLIELLPLGDELEKENGNEIAKKFVEALIAIKKLNNKSGVKVKDVQSGSTLMRIIVSIPNSVRLSEITKKSVIEDIQGRIGIRHLRIQQGENENEIYATLPLRNRRKVFLRNYIDDERFREFSKNNHLPFLVGIDEVGNPIYQCLNKARHVLVAGTTGSGKSAWVNQLIVTLLLNKSPKELLFYMIDVKRVELSVYKNFPHVQSVITDADESIRLLSSLITEMNSRYKLFEENNVKNISLYNGKNPSNKLPYIVCVIDEYAELALRSESVHDYVQTITQLSRASGIHLVIATQDPRKEVIPPIIKSNLPSKIGLRCSNVHSYQTFLNSRPPYNLLGNGDGVMAFEGQMDEYIRFQGCLIIDDDNDNKEFELIEDLADKISNGKFVYELPNDEVEMSEIEKLKRVIATTGETRVSKLREIMRVNINRLNDMMKELVDDGWLERPHAKQQGYKLLVSDDELERWR